MKETKHIIALTSDPYDGMYGYALVFFRIFDYIQKNRKDVVISLFSNDGVSSKFIDNKAFSQLTIDKNKSILIKTIKVVRYFIKMAVKCPKTTVIVVNAEIPEMIAGALLRKIWRKKVFCIMPDLRKRNNSLLCNILDIMRRLLMRMIKHAIFMNYFTMKQSGKGLVKYYFGCPVFYE